MKLPALNRWFHVQSARLNKNELLRRMLRNSGYLFSTNGIAAALGMVQGILAARLLGAAGYGVLGTIILFVSTLNNLVSFRMGELVVKYVGHYTEQGDTRRAAAVFKAAAFSEMLASLVALALVVLLAPIGARYFAKDESLAGLFILYGLVVLANLIAESSTGLLQIFDRFRQIAILNLTQSMITLALSAAVFFWRGSLQDILLAYLTGKTCSALGLSFSALREAGRRWGPGWWRAPLGLSGAERRELARFAISTNISASISLVTKDSELLWVSLLRGPTEAGYYKLALSLANLVQMPVDPLPQATYPELSRQVARQNWPGLRHLLRQGSLLAGSYSLLAIFFLTLLGRPLIGWLYSPEFLPAYVALLILMGGLLVANTFYWRRIALLALGRADFPAKLNLVLALLKLVAIFIWVPQYGYQASAALLAGFYLCNSLIAGWKINSLLAQQESRS